MTKTIWKFGINARNPRFLMAMPQDSKVLKVANGNMWIEGSFEDGEATKPVAFVIIGTGQEVPVGYDYAGTYFDGAYVWHLYTMVKYD